MPAQTNVSSFIVRFVQETTDATADSTQADWHGMIKHVQSDTEQHFTHLADAIAFMSRYVKLDDLPKIINSRTADYRLQSAAERDSDCATSNPQITNTD